MTIIQTLILSIVEGLTEFLPVSSTAHLVLALQILGVAQTDFVKSFEVIIQLGAILAVVVLYFKELVKNVGLWFKIIIAFLPSAILGFLLYDFIKMRLLGNGLVTALALIVGGVVFIFIDKIKSAPQKIPNRQVGFNEISTVRLLAIGLSQSLAMIPGVSRSAASIFGGMLTGLNKNDAVKFSFFLAIPTMLAATTLDLYKSSFSFSKSEILLLSFGFIGAFLTAVVAIKSFIKFVQKHTFLPFGIYRIAVGLFWLLAIIKL
ncbi:MAG: undecaprenyl-diphosphate phosphatase [Patescibacteria group bacterium]